MNRKERRARAAAAKKAIVDPVVAAHEAGHATARYLTAAEIGCAPEDSITLIEFVQPDSMVQAGFRMNAAGTAYLVPQATTFGPFLPSEIAALFVDAAGLQDGGTMSGQKANEALCRSVSQARADGADIERWLGRSALVAVMGALVESLKWKKPIDDVLYGHECENDVGGFVGYCRAAGVPDSGIPERLDAAIRRGLEYLVDPRVCAAVEELADHLYEHGTTEGKKAVEIIGRAMMK